MENEMEEKDDIDCAIETLLKAEEIKADAELMAKVKERSNEQRDTIMSIADLRKLAGKKREPKPSRDTKSEPPDNLKTEEDKAAIQEEERIDGKIKEMGLKQKSE